MRVACWDREGAWGDPPPGQRASRTRSGNKTFMELRLLQCPLSSSTNTPAARGGGGRPPMPKNAEVAPAQQKWGTSDHADVTGGITRNKYVRSLRQPATVIDYSAALGYSMCGRFEFLSSTCVFTLSHHIIRLKK